MQAHARFTKLFHTVVIAGSLAAALAFGGVLANENATGLTECDHGCKIEMLSRKSGDSAAFQMVRVSTFDSSDYISSGPGDIGFTR